MYRTFVPYEKDIPTLFSLFLPLTSMCATQKVPDPRYFPFAFLLLHRRHDDGAEQRSNSPE
ncbi:MAG TPA: hypothetical protein PLO67_14430 [Saprospiraceae bacterium]|nr:hypothetical protein [Saprospiraceae bacterium]HPI07232.1 hypothetical protein [Saprospiraceae bacterium]